MRVVAHGGHSSVVRGGLHSIQWRIQDVGNGGGGAQPSLDPPLPYERHILPVTYNNYANAAFSKGV